MVTYVTLITQAWGALKLRLTELPTHIFQISALHPATSRLSTRLSHRGILTPPSWSGELALHVEGERV
jgi:hypothetical protein